MKTKVLAILEKEKRWEFDFYHKFFLEMVNKEEIKRHVIKNDFILIESDNYLIEIIASGKQYTLGHRFDIVFCTIQDSEYYNECVAPLMCNSKFKKGEESYESL